MSTVPSLWSPREPGQTPTCSTSWEHPSPSRGSRLTALGATLASCRYGRSRGSGSPCNSNIWCRGIGCGILQLHLLPYMCDIAGSVFGIPVSDCILPLTFVRGLSSCKLPCASGGGWDRNIRSKPVPVYKEVTRDSLVLNQLQQIPSSL